MFINDLFLSYNVQLIKADSTGYNNNYMVCDILFIDADHKYESVKADYNHWIHTLKKGGHLLFHDSCGKEQGRIRIQKYHSLCLKYHIRNLMKLDQ